MDTICFNSLNNPGRSGFMAHLLFYREGNGGPETSVLTQDPKFLTTDMTSVLSELHLPSGVTLHRNPGSADSRVSPG